jgi:tetratricopeptide (TPR) repeat protein
MFIEGNYQEAQALFEQLLSTQPTGPLTAKARLGVAVCKEARGQTDAAISDYKSILEHSVEASDASAVYQVRFALGGLYLMQGQPDLARAQYEVLAGIQGSSLAAEAQARLAELPPSLVSRQVEVPGISPTVTATNQP